MSRRNGCYCEGRREGIRAEPRARAEELVGRGPRCMACGSMGGRQGTRELQQETVAMKDARWEARCGGMAGKERYKGELWDARRYKRGPAREYAITASGQ